MRPGPRHGVEPFLAGVLRGEAHWPADADAGAVVAEANYHGVLPLLFETAQRDVAWTGWPASLKTELLQRARAHAANELAQRRELGRILDLLAGAGIEVLVLKGMALAHTLYPAAWLRPCADADLLLAGPQRDPALAVLAEAGYAQAPDAGGELGRTQASLSRTSAQGLVSVIDLHWRLKNSPLLSGLAHEELGARAMPVPPLGPAARTPCYADALLLACLHRAGHATTPYRSNDDVRCGGDRLIWLYDIHLLAARLRADDWSHVVAQARRYRVCRVCLDALDAAQRAFATHVPGPVREALAGGAAVREPSAALLTASRWRIAAAEFEVLSWGQRSQYVRERVFPPAEYMLRKYHTRRRWLLPALYVRRALGWLTR